MEYFINDHPHWTYVVLFLWTLIEGETIVIICGYMASLKYSQLNVPLIMVFAFMGSLTSDSCMFWFGRLKGQAFLARHPKWKARAQKVYRIFEHHQDWLMLGFRFIYGVRNITPLSLGVSSVNAKKFTICNIIGASAWAIAFTLAGYFGGRAVEQYLHHYRWRILGGVCLLVFLVWLIRTALHVRAKKFVIRTTEEREIRPAGGLPGDDPAAAESSPAPDAGTESKP